MSVGDVEETSFILEFVVGLPIDSPLSLVKPSSFKSIPNPLEANGELLLSLPSPEPPDPPPPPPETPPAGNSGGSIPPLAPNLTPANHFVPEELSQCGR